MIEYDYDIHHAVKHSVLYSDIRRDKEFDQEVTANPGQIFIYLSITNKASESPKKFAPALFDTGCGGSLHIFDNHLRYWFGISPYIDLGPPLKVDIEINPWSKSKIKIFANRYQAAVWIAEAKRYTTSTDSGSFQLNSCRKIIAPNGILVVKSNPKIEGIFPRVPLVSHLMFQAPPGKIKLSLIPPQLIIE